MPLRELPHTLHPEQPVGSIILISRERTRSMLAARDRQTEESIATGLHTALDALEREKNPIAGKTSSRDDALDRGLVVVRLANGKLEAVPNDDGEGYWRAFQKAVNLPPFEGETRTLSLKGGVQLTLMNRANAVLTGYRLAGAQRLVAALTKVAGKVIQSKGLQVGVSVGLRFIEYAVAERRKQWDASTGEYGTVIIVYPRGEEGPELTRWEPNPGLSEEFFRLWIESGKSRVSSPL